MTRSTARTPTWGASPRGANNFMNMKKHLKSLRWLGVLVAAVFVLGACHGKRLTKANVDEVSKGMSRKQVESILGPPTA